MQSSPEPTQVPLDAPNLKLHLHSTSPRSLLPQDHEISVTKITIAEDGQDLAQNFFSLACVAAILYGNLCVQPCRQRSQSDPLWARPRNRRASTSSLQRQPYHVHAWPSLAPTILWVSAFYLYPPLLQLGGLYAHKQDMVATFSCLERSHHDLQYRIKALIRNGCKHWRSCLKVLRCGELRSEDNESEITLSVETLSNWHSTNLILTSSSILSSP